MSQNQQRFLELVRKGWDKVNGELVPELHEVEKLRETLYSTKSIDSAFYESYGVSQLPDIGRFNGTLNYVEKAPGYGRRIEPAEFGAYTEVERKLWKNNLYPVMKDWNSDFRIAMHRTMEKAAIKGYATLNSAAFDFMPWNEEGVAIASTAHTTKMSGVSTATGFSNLGTSAFDPTIVEAIRILMRGFRGLNGEILATNPNGFIGPTTLDQKFEEVTATPHGLYTANGTINVQNRRNWEYKTSQYFNDYSTKNWIMVDWAMLKKVALWISREENESGAEVDFMTKRLKFSIYADWGYGFDGWQAFYFNQVS